MKVPLPVGLHSLTQQPFLPHTLLSARLGAVRRVIKASTLGLPPSGAYQI